MKITSKFVCLLLTLVMVLAMIVPAMALEKGTITIVNPADGQTYSIYKMFDLESYDSGTGAHAYKITDDWKEFVSTGAGKEYFTVDEHGYVSLKEGVTVENNSETASAIATAALAYAKGQTTPIQPVATLPLTGAAEENKYTATELDLGYYLVESTLGAVCSLDTTNPNVNIKEKNYTPSIEKKVQEDSKVGSEDEWGESNTAEIGQTVNYKITVHAKSGAQNYVVHDTMDSGLTFSGTVNITGLTAKSAGSEDYDYELITEGLEAADPCSFHIVFAQSYLDTISADTDIVITYSATLNGNAVTTQAGNVNTAKLSYIGGVTAPVSTKTLTYAFDLVKTDKDGKLLDGAEFKLYDAETGGTEIKVVKEDGDTYRLAVTEEEKAAGAAIAAANGRAVVKGLDADTTYYLEETKQPTGYNKLTARQAVTIEGANLKTTMTGDTWTEGNGGVRVINQTGAELPATGGIGTTIFYVVGSILLVGAGVLLVVRKRMSMTKESD